MMMHFMFEKKSMDSGIQPIKKAKDLSRLSLKSSVYQQQDFTLKDGRKVSLNPDVMKVR